MFQNKWNGIRNTFNKQIQSRLFNMKGVIVDAKRERDFVEKWSIIDKKVKPEYYRAYRNLSKNDSLDFLPDYMYYALVEPILNNYQFAAFGNEKNFYDKILTGVNLPITILRNVASINLDKNYNVINLNESKLEELCKEIDSIFVKPTIDSGQGKNVMKFNRHGNIFKSTDGQDLRLELLNKVYKSDFIIQESLSQCDLLNQFNKDSINTLRILTYRSVKDNEVHVLHTTLRVGKKGALIDASRAGGRFCGVSQNGMLFKRVQDSKGNEYPDFNGFNVIEKDYFIPNFDKVLDISKRTAQQIVHHRVLALDVMIDSNDQPRLIEINPVNQGMFIFQAAIGPMFKEFTNEVIEYCISNRSEYESLYYHNV